MKGYIGDSSITFSTALIGVCLTSFYNYLLYHSLVESFSIVFAIGVFFFAWNSRRFSKNRLILIIGYAYLFVGFIDLLHMLSYKGMGVFVGYGADLPTQLWIAARFMESLSLFLVFHFIQRKCNTTLIFLGYVFVTTILLLSIFYLEIFPECLIEGSGLTPFKKTSEYIISLILFVTILQLFKIRGLFEKQVFRLLLISLILTIFSELAFTLYVNIDGLSNLVGHIFKIVSYYLIYKAVIELGLEKPYGLMSRSLKQSEISLMDVNQKLRLEIETRNKVQSQLEDSLQEKETLLREIHHRVKNNMAIISSLLNLQIDKVTSGNARDALQDSRLRVQTISLIHKTLSHSDRFSSINMQDYLSALGNTILKSFSAGPDIKLEIHAEGIQIAAKQVTPLSLIVTELLTNSLKYAFPTDRKGCINVSLRRLDQEMELIVADDGVGMCEGSDWEKSESLGLHLVHTLVKNQLAGSIEMVSQNGLIFKIKFTLNETS